MSSDAPDFEAVILCDDIRREDNGKALLIGVYAADIQIPVAPATLPLSLWVCGASKEAVNGVALRYALSATNEVVEIARAPSFAAKPFESFVIASLRWPLKIDSVPTTLQLQAQFGDGPWIDLLKKAVVAQGPNASK